jgi:RTX calcium-binding nonapeptide repeat (4 copies)
MSPSLSRRGCVAVVMLAVSGALTAPAYGATVAVDANRLVFQAAPGEANAMLVERGGVAGYDVFDDGAPLEAGPGCVALSRGAARCEGLILSADIDTGDRDDIVEAGGLPIPVTANGGAGTDVLSGGAAGDTLDGGDGIDTLGGGSGDDDLRGGRDSDQLDGDEGRDLLLGGPGTDVADGGDGDGDVVTGGTDADLVSGGPGDDQVNGDDGNDALTAGGGRDTVMTGAGADQVFVAVQSASAVDCRPGDAVRGGTAPLAPGCAAIPPHTPAPTVWPVRADSSGTPVGRAAQFRPVRPSGRVLRRGHTTMMYVRIPSTNNRIVRVRIQPFDRRNHRLRAFDQRVRAGFREPVKAPPPPARTWRIRVGRPR